MRVCGPIRLGYFVSEFPGQTHTFFWREILRLRAAGVQVALVSTRPPANAACHDFASARHETHYLYPPSPSALVRMVARHPEGMLRAAAYVRALEGLSLKQHAKVAALIPFAADLLSFAHRERLEHIHVHFPSDAGHIAAMCRLMGGPTFSLSLHAPLSDFGGNQRAKWGLASFGIIITETLLQDARRELADALPERIAVAPMGVNSELFKRKTPYEPWRSELPLRLVTCARLQPSKGQDDLLRAVALLRDQGFDARLVVCGGDPAPGAPFLHRLRSLAEELDLSHVVTFAGSVSEARIVMELEACHVFCLASHREPLGVAIMEAMAMELPVVVTSGGGVRELVTDGQEGFLAPPRDPAALAQRIKDVVAAPDAAVEVGRAARRRVVRSFQSTRSAEVLRAQVEGLRTDRLVATGGPRP